MKKSSSALKCRQLSLVSRSTSGHKSLPVVIEGEGKNGISPYSDDHSTIFKDVAKILSTEL